MEICVLDDKKRVEVWLTSADSRNTEINDFVEKVIKDYGSRKYFVVIFRSGTENLLDSTELLLQHNKTI